MSHHLPSLCQRKNAGNLFSEAPGIITFWENRDQAAATSNNPLPSCCYCLLTQILILKCNHHTEPVGPLYNALLFTYIYFPPITPHCFLLYFFLLHSSFVPPESLLPPEELAVCSQYTSFFSTVFYLLPFQLLLSSIAKWFHFCVSYENSYDKMPGPAVILIAVFAFFFFPIRFAVAFTTKLKEEAEIHLVWLHNF